MRPKPIRSSVNANLEKETHCWTKPNIAESWPEKLRKIDSAILNIRRIKLLLPQRTVAIQLRAIERSKTGVITTPPLNTHHASVKEI
jgi:hypothetical protein